VERGRQADRHFRLGRRVDLAPILLGRTDHQEQALDAWTA